METIKELEQKIINFTAKILEEYPELSKYISEMPANNSEDEKIKIENFEKYYQSLRDVVHQYSQTHDGNIQLSDNKNAKYADLQIYPAEEDIYQQFTKEADLNPENISKNKTPYETVDGTNKKDFQDTMTGSDLDVPGSELDDQQESIGSEDEENNYYSLGGDNHNDLDEDKA
ncbi:hypothetical protein SAMN05444372_11285 [Flavobacterium micromati]|uniref:Uncharacterized protein n=1 Tax=Flavobacterium micromati TaxID=229205 RepID=A0A1M5P6W1_9FLAO|nr:hypothetical protein [Flavobacterium micromati]SHG97516.1 hypothetical protein SAMN05444372_11285 [Flavobacterium micromati]